MGKCGCNAFNLRDLRRESQQRRPARQRRKKIGSGVTISKGGTVMNSAITHNASNKVTNACGCRTRPISSSFFNST